MTPIVADVRSDAAYAPAEDNSSIVCFSNESSRGSPIEPGELVSLWDMLRKYVRIFISLMEFLTDVEKIYLDSKNDPINNRTKEERVKWNKMVMNAKENDPGGDGYYKQLCRHKEILRALTKSFLSIKKICTDLHLKVALVQLYRLRELLTLETLVAYDYTKICREISHLRRLIEDEMSARMFFFVPPERTKYFLEEKPFGEKVVARFPKIAEDIDEASKCIGVARYAASVFHLMRVMEFGVGRLAMKLNKTISLNRAWGYILRDIDTEIRGLPGASHGASVADKKRYETFAEIAAYLHHVKDAWRNSTMHPKRTYTQEEAEHLFSNVRSFMQALVKIR